MRTRYGEIDIVALDGTCTVFVEVRTVRTELMAPSESITLRKQRRIAALGEWYLSQQGRPDAEWRADVIAISVPSDGRAPMLEHVIGAIEAR